jgi:hypothetical protein
MILFGVSLTSANAQGRRAAITGLAVLIGQGMNLVLLPILGVPAAVLGFIVTTCLLLVPYAREIRNRFGSPVRRSDVLGPLACSCLAAVPALLCRSILPDRDGALAILVTLSVYGVVYVAAAILFRGRGRGGRSLRNARTASPTLEMSASEAPIDPWMGPLEGHASAAPSGAAERQGHAAP